MDDTPASLVARIGEGDRTAESTLVTRYRRGLVLMLEGMCGNRAHAEDVAQETLLIVIQNLRKRSLEKPGALKSYIHQTAKFEFIGRTRKRDNQNVLTDDLDSISGQCATDEETWTLAEVKHLVKDYIGQLKLARDRDVLFRYYVLDQAKGDICASINMSPVQFDRVISRARKRFYELVKAHKQDLI